MTALCAILDLLISSFHLIAHSVVSEEIASQKRDGIKGIG
jgi:hypothetical protein